MHHSCYRMYFRLFVACSTLCCKLQRALRDDLNTTARMPTPSTSKRSPAGGTDVAAMHKMVSLKDMLFQRTSPGQAMLGTATKPDTHGQPAAAVLNSAESDNAVLNRAGQC